MRRLLPLAILLACVALSSVEGGDDRGARTSSFLHDGVRWEIRVVAREATVRSNLLGQLLLYTVRREATFVHPEEVDGGRFLGCVFGSYDTWKFGLAPFPDDENPIGWALTSMDSAGNATSRLVRLVTPGFSASDPVYREATLVSKAEPVVRRTPARLEVWSAYQHWGGAGTAASVFVPEVRAVGPDGAVREAPLDPDWETWPEPFRAPSLREAYVAGISQSNVALMRRAVERLYDPKVKEWYGAIAIPEEREDLLAAADAVETRLRADAKVARLTRNWFGKVPTTSGFAPPDEDGR